VHRTFTLLEAARLAGQANFSGLDNNERIIEFARLVTGHRGSARVDGERPNAVDIPDPYRQRASAYRKAYTMLEEATWRFTQAVYVPPTRYQ
jgi:protein-tyrosine-phosphatase